jgi:hypothetical protein
MPSINKKEMMLILASSTYQIATSLRFNSADTAYLNRTPGSAGDRKRVQFRCRVKRSKLGTKQVLFSAGTASIDELYFDTDDKLKLQVAGSLILVSSQIFKDTKAWYEEIGFDLDVTQATAANRANLIAQGANLGSYGTDNRASITNTATNINNTVVQYIGRDNGGNYFDGYMCDAVVTDNTLIGFISLAGACTAPSKVVGTQGAYLDFSDNSNTTAATLGADRSGNGNNWTPNNFSVTAGVGNDSLFDSPTDYNDGTNLHGNYATLDPSAMNYSTSVVTNGQLDDATSNRAAASTIVARGTDVYYAEMTQTSPSDMAISCGPYSPDLALQGYYVTVMGVLYRSDGTLWSNNVNQFSLGSTFINPDTVGIAVQPSSGKVWFRSKTGAWLGGGDPSTLTTPTYTITAAEMLIGTGGSSGASSMNYGQRAFIHGLPGNCRRLCTMDLPASDAPITSGSFIGNSSTNGPLVDLGGTPTVLTINGNTVTWGTHAIKTAFGAKIITSSASYNTTGSNTFTATVPVTRINSRAQQT